MNFDDHAQITAMSFVSLYISTSRKPNWLRTWPWLLFCPRVNTIWTERKNTYTWIGLPKSMHFTIWQSAGSWTCPAIRPPGIKFGHLYLLNGNWQVILMHRVCELAFGNYSTEHSRFYLWIKLSHPEATDQWYLLSFENHSFYHLAWPLVKYEGCSKMWSSIIKINIYLPY